MVTSITDNELYDICDYWHTPWWQTRFFHIVLALIGLALLAWLVYLLVRRMRARALIKTPWQRALEELDKLRACDAYKAGEFKQVYFSLIALVKTYLHERFGFDVLGKSDEELVSFLSSTDVPVTYISTVQALLQGSLLVRFARGDTAREQMERDIMLIYRFIEQTIPQQR